MKRISILCAAILAAGTYTPAMAIGTADPGYYNKCAAAYVNDPATYDRDCAPTMKSLIENTISAPPVVAPTPTPPSPGCTSINPLLLPAGMRVKVAYYDPCNHCNYGAIDARTFPIWARVKVATIC